jgi:hypothetical protein
MDKSKTSFGFSQISNQTPEWANWIFRGWFIISKAAIGYLGTLMAIKGINIPLTTFLVISATITMLGDPIMYGFSKLFGIVPDAPDPSKPLIADTQVDDKGNTKAINPIVVDPAK